MKKANTKIDFWQDKIPIFGKIVDITYTTIGHYCIKVDNKFSAENVFKSNVFFFW